MGFIAAALDSKPDHAAPERGKFRDDDGYSAVVQAHLGPDGVFDDLIVSHGSSIGAQSALAAAGAGISEADKGFLARPGRFAK